MVLEEDFKQQAAKDMCSAYKKLYTYGVANLAQLHSNEENEIQIE
jgi:hypothetical protein